MDDLHKETDEAPLQKKLPLAVSYEVRKQLRELKRQGGGWVRGPKFTVGIHVFRVPPLARETDSDR